MPELRGGAEDGRIARARRDSAGRSRSCLVLLLYLGPLGRWAVTALARHSLHGPKGAEIRVRNWAGGHQRRFPHSARPDEDEEDVLDDPNGRNHRRSRGDRNLHRRGGFRDVRRRNRPSPLDREGRPAAVVLGSQLSPWRNEWAGRLPRAYGIFIDGPVFPQVRRYLNNPPTTIQQARKASSAAVESFNAEPATRLVLWVGGLDGPSQVAAVRSIMVGHEGSVVTGMYWGDPPHTRPPLALLSHGFRVARRSIPAPGTGSGNTVRKHLCMIRPPTATPVTAEAAGFRSTKVHGRMSVAVLHDVLGDPDFDFAGYPARYRAFPSRASERRELVPGRPAEYRKDTLRVWARDALVNGGRLGAVVVYQ